MKVKITKEQLRLLVRAERCDCTDRQWSKRGDCCTTKWIRCNGRLAWKKANCPVFKKGLARLGEQP